MLFWFDSAVISVRTFMVLRLMVFTGFTDYSFLAILAIPLQFLPLAWRPGAGYGSEDLVATPSVGTHFFFDLLASMKMF